MPVIGLMQRHYQEPVRSADSWGLSKTHRIRHLHFNKGLLGICVHSQGKVAKHVATATPSQERKRLEIRKGV